MQSCSWLPFQKLQGYELGIDNFQLMIPWPQNLEMQTYRGFQIEEIHVCCPIKKPWEWFWPKSREGHRILVPILRMYLGLGGVVLQDCVLVKKIEKIPIPLYFLNS